MSRLTGKDALGLFEAYNAVYSPQEEISEEQIWEEVEEWVTSLVEEGYDLSEFTWEEMYEDYLNEGGAGPRAGTTPARPYMGPLSAGGGRTAIDRLTAKGVDPRKANAMVVAQGEKNLRARPAKPAKPTTPAATTPAKSTTPAATTPTRQARPAATTSARPTTPAATTPARPASTPAAAKPAPTAAAKPAAAAPAKTPNPLMQKTFGYQTGGAPDQVKSASTPAAAKPTPKPTPAATGSKKPGSIVSGFDMFDVVKGHLIGEGYADTEEAAIAIMANMSEEWKASIIEGLSSALFNKPSNTIGGGASTPSAQKKPGASAGTAQPRPAAKPGMTPMQRLQSRPDATIR